MAISWHGTLSAVPPPATFAARLASSRMLSSRVRELKFERSDGQPMDFSPGQWLKLDSAGVSAAYSIASAPSPDGGFSVAVRRTDDSTSAPAFFQLDPGDEVTANGPHGRFTRDPLDPSPALFIGHGTGITPLRSMIAASMKSRVPLGLLYGARGPEELLFADDFEDIAREGSLRFEVVLSQAHPGWQGLVGRVQSHVTRAWEALCARSGGVAPAMYLCGAPEMVKQLRAMASHDLSIAPERLHFER